MIDMLTERQIFQLTESLGLGSDASFSEVVAKIDELKSFTVEMAAPQLSAVVRALGKETGQASIGEVLGKINELKFKAELPQRMDRTSVFEKTLQDLSTALGLPKTSTIPDILKAIGELRKARMEAGLEQGRLEWSGFNEISKALGLVTDGAGGGPGINAILTKIDELLSPRNKTSWQGFTQIRESLGLSPDTSITDILAKMDDLKLAISHKGGELMVEADRVISVKGRDYTKGSSDPLANFRTAGNDAGITPLQAWLVFYSKHHAAICSYIRSGGQNESEPIFGRFVDALNYLRLGWLLVKDAQLAAEHEANK